MPKAKATKPKIKPPIEISDDELLSTSSTCSSLSSLCPSRKDKEVEEVDKLSLAYKQGRGRNTKILKHRLFLGFSSIKSKSLIK